MFRVIFLLALIIGIQGLSLNFTEDDDTDPEYMMFPDGNGKLHLIHLREGQYEPNLRFNVNNHIHFLLFTRENPENPHELHFNNVTSIEKSLLDSSKETYFLTHGWNSGPHQAVNVLIRRALLEVLDCNVIVMDWAYGASYNYFAAKGHAATAGTYLGKFIKILMEKKNLSLMKMHLIGHSLGAHVMGFAGKTVRKENGGNKVFQIVGLDPATPLYTLNNPDGRLEWRDAQYVEIIHTNGGKLGFWNPIGHADFYPNGGSMQPGCGLDMFGSCAHARSYEFYAESISRSVHFKSRKCRDVSQIKQEYCPPDGKLYLMGGKHPKQKYGGVFVLETAGSSPFALG